VEGVDEVLLRDAWEARLLLDTAARSPSRPAVTRWGIVDTRVEQWCTFSGASIVNLRPWASWGLPLGVEDDWQFGQAA